VLRASDQVVAGVSAVWHHTPAMRKTTVYLTESEAEGLRRTAVATGRSQAELIRQGVRLVIEQGPPRIFHSMGKGDGSGEWHPRWRSDELYEKASGRR
jgi:ribbon-helix-helix CopG family protein